MKNLSDDHKNQQYNCLKMIEHLEIAKSYCELMWSCAKNIPENALLANVESFNIQNLIDDSYRQLSQIGGSWESIECSVYPEKEF